MSALQKTGTLAWIATKLKEVADAAEIVQNATDPRKQRDIHLVSLDFMVTGGKS
jgi:hypothetical protein